METHRRWEVRRCRHGVTIVWAVWCGEVDGRVMSLELLAGEMGLWTVVQVEPDEWDCA